MAVVEQRRLAGDDGVWFFVVADMSMFAVFFALFMDARFDAPTLFEQGRQTLSVSVGFFNTLVLITSSFLMALAVGAARRNEPNHLMKLLRWTLAVGSLFAVSKFFEYGEKFDVGIVINTSEFYTYYYFLTGMHFFHYLGGMFFISLCLHRARQQASLDGRYVVWIESSGCYWHMVDLLWIMLFPMLYLLVLPQ